MAYSVRIVDSEDEEMSGIRLFMDVQRRHEGDRGRELRGDNRRGG